MAVMAPRTATFCGHCGALLDDNATFCGRCGAAVAAILGQNAEATAYTAPSPPVFAGPFAAIPGVPPGPPAAPRQKLSHRSLFLVSGGAIAVLVVVLTVVAVKVAGSPHGCGFYCGPHVGPRLADQKAFTDTKWNFTVDYSGTFLQLNTTDPTSDTVDFTAQDANGNTIGEIAFTGMQATSTQQAVQNAMQNDFPSSTYQDIKEIEAVNGAEVGLIQGDGVGSSAVQSGTNGSSGQNVTLFAMAATHGNTTVVTLIWGVTDQQSDGPFYLGDDQEYDNVISNLSWGR